MEWHLLPEWGRAVGKPTAKWHFSFIVSHTNVSVIILTCVFISSQNVWWAFRHKITTALAKVSNQRVSTLHTEEFHAVRSYIVSNHTLLLVGLPICHLLGTCFFLDQIFSQILCSWVFPCPGDSSKMSPPSEGLSPTPCLHKVMDPSLRADTLEMLSSITGLSWWNITPLKFR